MDQCDFAMTRFRCNEKFFSQFVLAAWRKQSESVPLILSVKIG